MKNLPLYVILLIFFSACAVTQKSTAQQGIIGELRWVEGNLMPAIGDDTYAERARGKAFQRTAHIFEAVKMSGAEKITGTQFYKAVNAKLVAKIKSNEEGKFNISLPPGKYSVFTEEEGGLFANLYDGDGFINPVTVKENQWTEVKILINYKAFY